jgi:glyoxylase-like metal-dependent hydrolase (beta-lactamase superfamily II)
MDQIEQKSGKLLNLLSAPRPPPCVIHREMCGIIIDITRGGNVMQKLILALAIVLLGPVSAISQQAPRPTALREIIPGHYAFSSGTFNSGIIVTSEGVVVLDALNSESVGRAEREAIAGAIRQPVRFLVSSTFHNNYSKGNVAYADVWKIGHENYRTDLLQLMQREKVPAEEQKARLPNETYRNRVTFYLGGKEIQIRYLGRGHTRGDSIIYVPEDRIAYLSELFFAEQFLYIDDGYGLDWLKTLDSAEALGAEIFVPAHGPIPADPRQTRQGLDRFRQMLVDIRDSVQQEIARGATEEQAVATIRWPQYEKMQGYNAEREVAVRRLYRQMTGALP